MFLFLGKFGSLPLLPTKLVVVWLLAALLPSNAQTSRRSRPDDEIHRFLSPKSQKLRHASGFGAFAIVAATVFLAAFTKCV